MDKFIKAIISHSFIDADAIITSDKIKKSEYDKLYTYFMYFYIKGQLDDLTMYYITFIFFQNHKLLKIKNLHNYNDIISWHVLRCKTLALTHELLRIYMDINITKRRIKSSINLLKDNSKNLKKMIGKHKKDDKVNHIITRALIEYPSHYNDRIMQNSIMMANTDKALIWVHEEEIGNRLKLLVKYYGINLLQILGVNIINESYFSMLSFDEKVTYYKDCLGIILNTGKAIQELYNTQKKIKKRRHHHRHKYMNYVKKLLENPPKK